MAVLIAALTSAVGASAPAGAVAAHVPAPSGYLLAASDGGVFAFGRPFLGSAAPFHPSAPIVGIASTPAAVPASPGIVGGGYWLAASDGGVFSFGNAGFFGSLGRVALNQPIVGIAATPDGGGYWMVAADGGVFSFGNAAFFGSLAGAHILSPVVGIASTADGRGYWLLTSGGEAFAFGDALVAAPALQAPAGTYVGIARIAGTVRGVELVASDGTRAAFETDGADCLAVTAAHPPMNAPAVGVAAGFDCSHWVAASDGGVFAFEGAPFLGSAASVKLAAPIVAIAS